jgi:hypothetical protein
MLVQVLLCLRPARALGFNGRLFWPWDPIGRPSHQVVFVDGNDPSGAKDLLVVMIVHFVLSISSGAAIVHKAHNGK